RRYKDWDDLDQFDCIWLRSLLKEIRYKFYLLVTDDGVSKEKSGNVVFASREDARILEDSCCQYRTVVGDMLGALSLSPRLRIQDIFCNKLHLVSDKLPRNVLLCISRSGSYSCSWARCSDISMIHSYVVLCCGGNVGLFGEAVLGGGGEEYDAWVREDWGLGRGLLNGNWKQGSEGELCYDVSCGSSGGWRGKGWRVDIPVGKVGGEVGLLFVWTLVCEMG
ncbi:hypothetical protein Tco_1071088, partial [Tanacetum coccineum]